MKIGALLLAGDIGGTKTKLAVYHLEVDRLTLFWDNSYTNTISV